MRCNLLCFVLMPFLCIMLLAPHCIKCNSGLKYGQEEDDVKEEAKGFERSGISYFQLRDLT